MPWVRRANSEALILQCLLASSHEAIYQSLRWRGERLESRLPEFEVLQRDGQPSPAVLFGVSESRIIASA